MKYLERAIILIYIRMCCWTEGWIQNHSVLIHAHWVSQSPSSGDTMRQNRYFLEPSLPLSSRHAYWKKKPWMLKCGELLSNADRASAKALSTIQSDTLASLFWVSELRGLNLTVVSKDKSPKQCAYIIIFYPFISFLAIEEYLSSWLFLKWYLGNFWCGTALYSMHETFWLNYRYIACT